MAERLSREELEARYDELELKYNSIGWQLKALQRENERLRNTTQSWLAAEIAAARERETTEHHHSTEGEPLTMVEKNVNTMPNGRRIYSALDEDGTKMYVDKHGRVRYCNVQGVSEDADDHTMPNGRLIYSAMSEDGTKLYVTRDGRVPYTNIRVVYENEDRSVVDELNDAVHDFATEYAAHNDMRNRLAAECEAHENTKARLAEARRLHAVTALRLERAYESMKRMSDVLDSIEPEYCEHCGENDPHSCEDDPHSCEDDDPIFYASPESGVARNTAELLEMIDEEENEEYDRDEY